MEIKDLQKPLSIDNIDFRIQSINKGGYATILAYKDARVDMERLDEIVGPLNWKREHTRDNKNCIVSIYNSETKEWISKEDTGTESFTEQEKGLASDSFKRACFNWGIGRELYDYPVIQIKLNGGDDKTQNKNAVYDEWYMDIGKPKQGYGLKLKDWTWASEFNSDNKLISLQAKDDKGTARFTYKKTDTPKTKPKFTQEVFDKFKTTEKYKDQFEAYKNIEAKYDLDLPMRKKIKEYYESKGGELDITQPF